MTNDKARLPATDGSQPSQNGTHAARDHDIDQGAQAVGRSKFDLGLTNGHLPSEDIPWGYGESRVTSMARDPDWLYVYWEITDDAIADARKRLGPASQDAWCCLRIYDTSGRVFDGTNAVSYFDIAIDRTSRDWFVHVGKPQSSCHVEIGVKSRQGDFQAMARSGRTDFARKRPVQDLSVEWLTVQELKPPVAPPPVAAPYVSRYDGPVPELPQRAVPAIEVQHRHAVPFRVIVDQHVERQETWRTTWTERRTFAWSTRVSHRFEGAYHRLSIPWISEPWRTEWQGDQRAFEWLRPLHKLTWSQVSQTETWEMSPYPGDSAAPGRVLVRYLGESQVQAQQSGQTSMVVGPWEVTIHGLSSGETERRVLGAWLLHWIQPLSPVRARWELTAERVWFDGFTREGALLGASESQFWVERGASELWALGGSEQLWLGASELLSLGGSEQLWLGASEERLAGASELVAGWSHAWLGASELSLEAVSELLARGASERFAFGASEELVLGASEQWSLGAVESFAQASSELLVAEYALGASERMGEVAWVTLGELVGASELLGASERWGASEEVLAMTLGASEQLGASDLDVGPPSHDRPIGGASEMVPGMTGPRFDAPDAFDNPQDLGLLLGASEWSAIGASEEVASATYPDSLQQEPANAPTDVDAPGDDEKEGG